MIGRRSRYAASILYTSGEGDFLGTRLPTEGKPRPDDRFHTVVEGDRVDLLAHRYLGQADLWWNHRAPIDLEPGCRSEGQIRPLPEMLDSNCS